jgi:hypothetical protein
VTGVASEFDLQWPSYVKTFLKSIAILNEGSDRVFSFECFAKRAFGDGINEFIVRSFAYAISPFLIFIPSMIVVIIALLVTKSFKKSLKKMIVITSVVVAYVLYPSILNACFSIFDCKTLSDGNRFVTRDLSVVCYSSTHLTWIFTLGLPMMVVWVIGIPLAEIALLFFYRKNLDNEATVPYYGFFYRGLT